MWFALKVIAKQIDKEKSAIKIFSQLLHFLLINFNWSFNGQKSCRKETKRNKLQHCPFNRLTFAFPTWSDVATMNGEAFLCPPQKKLHFVWLALVVLNGRQFSLRSPLKPYSKHSLPLSLLSKGWVNYIQMTTIFHPTFLSCSKRMRKQIQRQSWNVLHYSIDSFVVLLGSRLLLLRSP